MAHFSLSGPNILFHIENMGRDLVRLGMIMFYYGERRGKLCLIASNRWSTMHPGQGIMAYFSLSGPNILFHIENMGRDPVPLAIIIFYYGQRRQKIVSKPNLT